MCPSASSLGKNTNRMMTARLKYIRARSPSRFQSILFCLIQMHILTSIQTAVKVNSAEKKDISNILPPEQKGNELA
jgi:hypothetical protein